jgi:4-amino-4-deoxy-L-arabinose transferase-like glycosyltransferase
VSARLRRWDPWLVAILLTAAALRLQLAVTATYIHDEDRTSIPLSKTISFTPDSMHLPLRGENHGALPAYVVKVSSAVFGTTPLAYRALHVLLGLLTVALLAQLTTGLYGPWAGRWCAALLSFNEYYLAVSSRATAHVPHLLLVGASLYSFTRFLSTERAGYLYGTAAAIGLAFYAKEHSALLVPVFFLALLRSTYRPWLRRPHPYLACAVFLAIISPDLLWNLRTDPSTATVSYSETPVGQSTYRSHLARIGGLGFSPYPAMFYGHSAVQAVHTAVVGSAIPDDTPEYQAMNPAIGALLLAGVLLSTVRSSARERAGGFLLMAFWCIFGFFTLIEKGESIGRLDPASWIWVESTLLSACVLTGARLAELATGARALAWTSGAAALLVASAAPLGGLRLAGVRAGQETVSATSHLLQTIALGTVDYVRLRPLYSLGLAVAGGLAIGALLGFLAGWMARHRRTRRSQ